MGWNPSPGSGAPSGPAGGDLADTFPDPTIGAGKVTTAKIGDHQVTLAKMAATLPWLLVQAGPPSTFTSPFVFDSTAVTGGLYGWNGSAYQHVTAAFP